METSSRLGSVSGTRRDTGDHPPRAARRVIVALRPLKVLPADVALRLPIVFGVTAYVTHNTQRYSMPPDELGLPGTLYLYRDTVRIVARRFEPRHTRL